MSSSFPRALRSAAQERRTGGAAGSGARLVTYFARRGSSPPGFAILIFVSFEWGGGLGGFPFKPSLFRNCWVMRERSERRVRRRERSERRVRRRDRRERRHWVCRAATGGRGRK